MTRLGPASIALLLLASCAVNAAAASLSPADTAAAFKAAGFARKGAAWTRCDDASPGYASNIEAADLNRDGAPEAWVRESSTMCYGATGEAFVLLTKRGPVWTPLLDETGIAVPHAAKHLGWPDIEIGGPGMGPFPVYRFNGTKYVSR
jgi:hypothetical protein